MGEGRWERGGGEEVRRGEGRGRGIGIRDMIPALIEQHEGHGDRDTEGRIMKIRFNFDLFSSVYLLIIHTSIIIITAEMWVEGVDVS